MKKCSIVNYYFERSIYIEVRIINILALSLIAYYDKKFYKIPNFILVFTIIINIILRNIFEKYLILNQLINLIFIILGSFIIFATLKLFINIKAGDIKLFSLMIFLEGTDLGLKIVFITLLISLIPIMKGVKKVPLGVANIIAYTAFYIFNYCWRLI